ncbi:MAG: ABC transporter permease [Flavobacteriales bacterium]
MSKIGLIISREYSSRVKKKSFLVMTILGPVLIAALMAVVVWLSMPDQEGKKFLIIDETEFLYKKIEEKPGYEGFLCENCTLDEAKSKFKDSKSLDYLLYFPNNMANSSSGIAQVFYKKSPSFRTQRFFANLATEAVELHRLDEKGISYEDYKNLRIDIKLETFAIDTEKQNDFKVSGGVGFAFAFFIYFFIFLYAVQVMRGVIEEKTSRIVEVIISSVKPFQLMLGKIVGIALVGLTQFAIWVILTGILIVAVVSIFMPDMYDPAVQAELNAANLGNGVMTTNDNAAANLLFRDINWPLMLGMFLFYFLGGYLLYASLMAAVGAAVDSETDTQQFMLPITMPLILGFVVAQMTIENPDSVASFWFAQIPFTSPIVMMVRVAMGVGGSGVPVWELISSMVILVATFIFTTWLAGKIYRTGILMYGKKVTYKDLFKWIFLK